VDPAIIVLATFNDDNDDDADEDEWRLYPIVEYFILVIVLEVKWIDVERIHDVVVVFEPHKQHNKVRRINISRRRPQRRAGWGNQ